MSTNTSTTGQDPHRGDSTVRPGYALGAASSRRCPVRRLEPARRHASGGGGGGRRRPHRGGAPCVIVQVGTCLTYAYDQAAIDSLLCTRACPQGGLG